MEKQVKRKNIRNGPNFKPKSFGSDGFDFAHLYDDDPSTDEEALEAEILKEAVE